MFHSRRGPLAVVALLKSTAERTMYIERGSKHHVHLRTILHYTVHTGAACVCCSELELYNYSKYTVILPRYTA
jgi:hypothetical protein